MTTLFDIGDEIEFTIRAKVDEITVSKNGDCYIVTIKQDNFRHETDNGLPPTRLNINNFRECALYLDSEALKLCKAKKVTPELTAEDIERFRQHIVNEGNKYDSIRGEEA